MALVSIQIVDGPESIQVAAAIEPGLQPGQEDLTPAQALGATLLEALKNWLDEVERAQAAKPVIAHPTIALPRDIRG